MVVAFVLSEGRWGRRRRERRGEVPYTGAFVGAESAAIDSSDGGGGGGG